MPDDKLLPTVSIVTPVLNGAQTLARCLDSVAAQGDAVLEHVVVDGGSTDGGLDLVRERASRPGSRLVWSTGRDRGIADAFNKGVAACRGDWIGILNADDWYEAGIVERLRPLMTAEAILHGRLRQHDPDTGQAREVGRLDYDPEIDFQPLKRMPAQHPTCFVPKSVYDRVGPFDTGFRLAMDYDWLLRAHLAGVPFVYRPDVIVNFARGGASGQDPRRAAREVLASQILHRGVVLVPLLIYLGKLWRAWRKG